MSFDFHEFEDWLYENFKHKTVENSLRAYRYLERNGVKLEERDTFREWMRDSRRKGVLDRTLNDYIKVYNRVLTYRNEPKIKFYKELHSLNRPIATQDDYALLMKAAGTFGYTRQRKILIIEILFKTGARLNELATLTVESVHGDTARVIGKGQKEAKLYLLPSVRRALDRYLRVRISSGTNRIFTNQAGKAMTYDGIRQEIYQIAQKAGINFSAHRARRFFARYLYNKGVDLEGIRLLMRHTKFDTTKEYIQMAIDDAIDSVRDKDLDFSEAARQLNPLSIKRPGRASFQFSRPKGFTLWRQPCSIHF